VFTFIFIYVILPNVQCIRVNHSEAVRLCKYKGGLVNSSFFPRIEVPYSNIGQPRESVLYSQLKNVDLDDGKSAWVAGYVKYINTLYYHIGCPYIDLDRASVFAASDEHLGFYQCSQYCEYQASKDPDIEYFLILLQTIKCLCLRYKSRSTEYSSCFQTKTDVVLLRAPMSRKVTALFGFFQCLYKLRTPKGDLESYTSKCLEKKHTVCYEYENASYHVANSSTWMRGVKECNRLGGFIMPLTESVTVMDINKTYWLGVSAYTIQTELGDACLAVTRVGDQLVLEPDDCRANNSFICASDITPNSNDTKVIPTSKQTTSLNAITSVNQTSISSDSKETGQLASGIVIIIVLIVIASCLGVVAVAAITALVYSRKRNANTERRQSNVAQENVAMNDNIVGDDVYHEYATIDDIVHVEVSKNEVAGTKTSMNTTRVYQNETIDEERASVCSGNTSINMEKDATTLKPETNIHMSNKITNKTDLNEGACRLSQGTLNIRKRDNSDTSESASEIYIEDVLLEKQLTNKREERDTYVFQAAPTHAAVQGQKAAEIEMSSTKFASLLDAAKTRKQNDTDTTLDTSYDCNDGVVWREPPGCSPEESEVKDYAFVPEEGQELYLTPTNI